MSGPYDSTIVAHSTNEVKAVMSSSEDSWIVVYITMNCWRKLVIVFACDGLHNIVSDTILYVHVSVARLYYSTYVLYYLTLT